MREKQTCKGGLCLAENVVKARQDGFNSSLQEPDREISDFECTVTAEKINSTDSLTCSYSKAALRWLACTVPRSLWNTWIKTSRSGEPVATRWSCIVQISGKSSSPRLGPSATAAKSCKTAKSTFTPKTAITDKRWLTHRHENKHQAKPTNIERHVGRLWCLYSFVIYRHSLL